MVDRNSDPEEFACIWQSKRVGIITIETKQKCKFTILLLPNIYEGVIDASVNTCCKLKIVFLDKRLYFLGRQYFEMESLYQTESFPDCVHFFGAWARQSMIESIAVVYELTKRTQEMLFAEWAQ